MVSKSDKSSIKFWLALNIEITYVRNALPYLWKDKLRLSSQSLVDRVVSQLMEPYLRKGKNMTTNNFFTSLDLARQVKKKETRKMNK